MIDLSQNLTVTLVWGRWQARWERTSFLLDKSRFIPTLLIVSQSRSQKEVKIIIVGTHRDLEDKSNESREEKEDKVTHIIASLNLEINIEDYAIGQNIMEVMINEEEPKDVYPLHLHLVVNLQSAPAQAFQNASSNDIQ